MNRPFPPVPQTGRHPITLMPEQEKRLLSRRVTIEHTDPFATDPNAAIRLLGRLALRRAEDDPSDYFALGDLCAAQSLANGRLLIAYVGKALIAYRRAGQIARQFTQTADAKRLAEKAADLYIRWVLDVARIAPSTRNIAVALWVATEIAPEQDWQREIVVDLATQYITASMSGLLADEGGRRTAEMTGPFPPPVVPEVSEAVILNDTQSDLLDTQAGDKEHRATSNDPDVAMEGEPSGESLTVVASDAPASQSPIAPPPRPLHVRDAQDTLDFRSGDRLGDRYEVRHILRGGMGIIYLCYDHEAQNSVAIKTFQGRFLNNERAIARFIQEAHTWIQLEKHNHIVQARKVQTFGDARVRERPHILLEYIAGPEGLGPDLKSWIEHNRLDLTTTVEIGLHICLGMHHAVQRVPGLVHRDLKPANILVRHDGLAKVTDFGLVRSLDSALKTQEMEAVAPFDERDSNRLTRAGMVVGTAPYMSPEQCAVGDVDVRADIYAFGAILYEMLTGQRLFKARTGSEWIDAHLYAVPAFPPGMTERIPADLRDLTLRCLAKQKEDRPANWEVLRDELAAIYQRLTGVPPVYEVSGAALEARELMDQAYSLTELGYGHEALVAYDRALEFDPHSAWVWARKGRTLRVLQRHEEALTCYDRALELDPKFAWAWSGKGIVLERLSEFDLALEAYETASRLRPNDVWAIYNQANLLFASGHSLEALTRLDRVLLLDPNHVLSHTWRGKVLLALKRFDEAAQAFDRAIALDSTQGQAWLGKGLVLRELRQHDEAATAFMQATRLMPEDIAPWLRLADALVGLDRYADALPAIQQATRLKLNFKGAWVRLGLILRELNRHAEALEAYDRALSLNPAHAPALSGKGEALERLGKFEEALVNYRAAVSARPDRTLYLYQLADLLTVLRRAAEALPIFEQLVLLNPESKSTWARMGRLYHREGRLEEAEKAYAQAVTLDAEYAWAWNGKGMVLIDMDRLTEALHCFEEATRHDASKAWYWHNRANTLAELGRFDEALKAFDQVQTLNSQDVGSWSKRGQVLRRLKRYEEALAAYDRALALAPHDAWAWNGRGLTLERLGRREEAITNYERAIEEAPSVLWYRLNLIDPLLALDRRNDALDVCDDALESLPPAEPIGAIPWTRKGQVLRRMNRHEEAITAYERALALNLRYAAAWNGKGLACAELGRREEALACYQKAAETAPSNAWNWYNQGAVLIELGRYEEAIHVLNRALEIDPQHERSRLKRDEARQKLHRAE